jgi:hypothetical protein
MYEVTDEIGENADRWQQQDIISIAVTVCAVCKMHFLLVILYPTKTVDMPGFGFKVRKGKASLYRRGQTQRIPGG